MKEYLTEMSEKMICALTTRFSDIASTIRASIYKQGERNLIHNILNGNGYEGVIEIWQKKRNDTNRNN